MKEKLPTLKDIISKYPPKEEIFEVKHYGKEEGTCSARVSRDEEGLVLYVVPGSCVWIKPPEKNSGGEV